MSFRRPHGLFILGRTEQEGGSDMAGQRTIGTVRSADGTAIAFERVGDGQPVILVGGALNDRSFQPLVELAALLGADYAVHIYDRRGRGDSGDTTPYAVEREVDDLEAVISEAGE